MTDDPTMTTTLPVPDDSALVALSAADLQQTQTALLAHCDRMDAVLARELSDLDANAVTAAEAGWRTGPVHAAIRRAEQRRAYYAKIRAAVEAGYVIVPNFPITVLAVRVRGAVPRPQTGTHLGSWRLQTKTLPLPAGVGAYVDDRLAAHVETTQTTGSDGKTRESTEWIGDEYAEPDFPVRAVKPAVLQATHRAMALRIFDRIGMVQNSGGRDPIMVGQLLDPRGRNRLATFFVAWWLELDTL